MSFQEVREEILEEHRQLCIVTGDVETLCDRLEAGDGSAAASLVVRGRALYERFAAHLAREDRVLLPSVQQIWGRESCDRLMAEHREQRELLSYLVGRLSQPGRPALLLARELRQFGAMLREDMDHEEQTLLRAEGPGPPIARGADRLTR